MLGHLSWRQTLFPKNINWQGEADSPPPHPLSLTKQLSDSKHAGTSTASSSATHTWNCDYTSSVTIKRHHHLLRTASREGPSVLFLCECLKEKRKCNKTLSEDLTGWEVFICVVKKKKRRSGLICLDLIDQVKRKERGQFSHRCRYVHKGRRSVQTGSRCSK